MTVAVAWYPENALALILEWAESQLPINWPDCYGYQARRLGKLPAELTIWERQEAIVQWPLQMQT